MRAADRVVERSKDPRKREGLVRLHVPQLFAAPEGHLLHLDNFRHREMGAAIDASGVIKPARIYDLRSTFASNALAAGMTVFELARVIGDSVEVIERHYGALRRLGSEHRRWPRCIRRPDVSSRSVKPRISSDSVTASRSRLATPDRRFGREWVAAAIRGVGRIESPGGMGKTRT
jgi:hypothetical protein